MLGAFRSKKNNPVVLLLLGFVVVLMAGFGVSFSSGSGGKWAARVEGDVISYSEYAPAYARAFKAQLRRDPRYDRSRAEAENLRQQVLDQMIGLKLMAVEARRRGLFIDDETLRNRIVSLPQFQIDGRFDPDIYERAVRQSGTHPIAFEKSLREQLLAAQLQALVQGVGPSEQELRAKWTETQTKLSASFVKILAADFEGSIEDITDEDVTTWVSSVDDPDALISDHYEQFQRTRYNVPKQVCARHILIRSPKSAPPETKKKHRERIQEAAKAVAEGEDFAEAAKKFSQDGTKSRGGDLGCFGPGQTMPKLEETAFGMEKGATSGIVETQIGLHIIRVYDIKAAIRRKLEDVKDEIKRELAQNTRAQTIAKNVAAELLVNAKKTGGLSTAVATLENDGSKESPKKLPKLIVEDTGSLTRSQSYVPKLGIITELKEPLWNLSKEAPLSPEPLKTDEGWVVFEFKTLTKPAETDYEQQRRSLLFQLSATKQNAIYERLIDELKAQSAVQVNPAAISYDDELRQRIFQ